jgi:bacterioferritin-associated ferredoxin
MIVCSCNAFSDADVRDCLGHSEAPRSARDVYGCLGYAPKCGVCLDTIRKIMESERRLAAEAEVPAVTALNQIPKSPETGVSSRKDYQ